MRKAPSLGGKNLFYSIRESLYVLAGAHKCMSSLLYSQLYVIIIYLDCVTNDTMEHIVDKQILAQAIKQQKESLGIDIEVKIKKSSRQTLYKKRVDALAKSMVAKVIKTSSLELQEPDEHTKKAIYAKFVKKIKAMPEEKVWRTRV